MPCQYLDCTTPTEPTVQYNGLNVCLKCVAIAMKLHHVGKIYDNIIYSSKNRIVDDAPVCESCSA